MEQSCEEMRSRATAIFFLIIGIIATVHWGCTPDNEQRANNARAAYSKAEAFYNAGHYGDAREAFSTAAEMFEEMKDDSTAGGCWAMTARCWQQLGWYDSAMGNYQRALRMYETTGNKKLERRGKISLARFQQYVGDASAALQLSLDVNVSGRIQVDVPDIYEALDIASGSYHELGEFEQEVSMLDQLIGLDSVLNGGENRFLLMNNKIRAYEMMGQHGLACLEYQKILNSTSSSAGDTSLVQTYYNWGMIQQQTHHPDSALRAFSMAVSTIDRHMDPVMRIKILSSLGSLAYRSRHFENARMYFSDALDVAKNADAASYVHLMQSMILACDWKTAGVRSSALAQEFLNRGSAILSACEQDDYLLGEAVIVYLQARIKEDAGDSIGVQLLYGQALNIALHQSQVFTPGYLEKDFLDLLLGSEKPDWSGPVLSNYCATGKVQSAFELLERQRQQSIQDYFSRLHIKTHNDRLNREIAEYSRWRSMNRRLERDIFRERSYGAKKNAERLQSFLARVVEDSLRLVAAEKAIAKENINFYWLLSGMPPTLKQVQDSMRASTALIEFIPLQDCIYILVVEHDTTYIRKSDCSRARLAGIAQDYLKIFSDPRVSDANAQSFDYVVDSRLEGLADLLGQILLQPIVPLLGNLHAIEIVPSWEIGWIPIHTLNVNGKPIIDQIAVSYLPSAAAVFFEENTDVQVFHVGAIGHPGHTTWDVEYELRDIRSFYDSAQIFIGQQVTFETFRNAAYDALHLALEFTLDTEVPDRSSFYIADGRTSYGLARVSLGDALQVPSPHVLIFSNLSAHVGDMAEYAPLAFLANGVPNVITTLWQGSRREKRYFGEVFYTAMKGGLIPSEAYMDAVLAVKKKNDFSRAHRWGLYYRFGK
jgi:tetratricopeptide (TPR) repeat protein